MSRVNRRSAGGKAGSVEVTPLSHRIMAMSAFRVVLLGCIVLMTWGSDAGITHTDVTSWLLFVAAGVVGVVALAVRTVRFAVRVFGAGLLADAVFVEFWHERLGHTTPVDVVVASLLVTVCLLASYRTGLKLAVWQSLLLILAWRSEEAGLVAMPESMAGVDRGHAVFVDMVLLWVVVLTTSVASSINERELRRRRHDAEGLRGLASQLLGDHTDVAVLERLCGFLTSELMLARIAVIRRDPGTENATLHLVAGAGLTTAPRSKDGESALLSLVARHGDSVLALRLDPTRDEYLAELMPQALRVVAIPLRREGRAVTAVLEFSPASRGGRVERRVISSAQQACATSALALARAELLAASQRDALLDGLTGLANRRCFDQTLAEELARGRREGLPMALVLADVDFFKRVNDVYGHQIGDQVLEAVGSVLRGSVRKTDLAARYGGEEFALVLPGCDAATATRLAEQVRLRIIEVEDPVPITMSFGVAIVPDDATDEAGLILAADAALLSAKESGRNQVIVASSTTTTLVSQRAGS